MIRLFTFVSYLLVATGVIALFGGLITLDLTPLILGGILVGLGGVLLLLARLERRLTHALPALNTLAQTASFLARKESSFVPTPVDASDVSPEREPSRVRLRHHLPGAVDADSESRGSGAARA